MTTIRILLLLLLAAISAAAQAPTSPPTPAAVRSHGAQEHEGAGSALERAAGMLREVAADNAAFVKQHGARDFESFRDSQHPRAILVACADSRFHIDAIDRSPDDDVFEIRNIRRMLRGGTSGSICESLTIYQNTA